MGTCFSFSTSRCQRRAYFVPDIEIPLPSMTVTERPHQRRCIFGALVDPAADPLHGRRTAVQGGGACMPDHRRCCCSWGQCGFYPILVSTVGLYSAGGHCLASASALPTPDRVSWDIMVLTRSSSGSNLRELSSRRLGTLFRTSQTPRLTHSCGVPCRQSAVP